MPDQKTSGVKDIWSAFLRYLKERGLKGVELFILDKCLGLVESLGEFYQKASWQRREVHFYRNVFTVAPKRKVKEVAAMLKAIHAQEDKKETIKRASGVVDKLMAMKLSKAADILKEGIKKLKKIRCSLAVDRFTVGWQIREKKLFKFACRSFHSRDK